MSDWSTMNWLNVFFIFVSGYIAIDCFEDGRDDWGWFNLGASAINAATVAAKIL